MLGVTAILLIGGNGTRFKSPLPKQFHRMAGKKIYIHTLEKFIASSLFEEILIVCPERWINEVRKDVQVYLTVPIRVVAGGETRQKSSYAGLLACGTHTRYVVIHDGVRPFVDERILKENVELALKYSAVDTCIPSTDTLVHTKDGQAIAAIPERTQYWRGQTPQSFSYPLILEAHEKASAEGILNASDDCSLVLSLGKEISIVKGEERNMKITSELDLFLAEQILRLEPPPLPKTDKRTSLKGKIYAVAGGTGGIGSALVRLLEQEGATAFSISRNSNAYCADLTHSDEARKIFERISREHGPIDGLINSVGSLQLKNFEDLNAEEIENQIAVNLKSLMFACKWVKIKAGGHIVNIASSSYSKGRAGYSVYSATKAAVVNFTQALAEELPHLQINTLSPERTNTKMRRHCFPNENPSTLLSPDQVADSIVALLKQPGITGTIVAVRKEQRGK